MSKHHAQESTPSRDPIDTSEWELFRAAIDKGLNRAVERRAIIDGAELFHAPDEERDRMLREFDEGDPGDEQEQAK